MERRGGRTVVSDVDAGRDRKTRPRKRGMGAVKVLVGSGLMVISGVAYAQGPNLLCERRVNTRGQRTALDLAGEATTVVVPGVHVFASLDAAHMRTGTSTHTGFLTGASCQGVNMAGCPGAAGRGETWCGEAGGEGTDGLGQVGRGGMEVRKKD